jgi:excisionase family DNA binding protein
MAKTRKLAECDASIGVKVFPVDSRIRQMVRAGQLPAMQVGRAYLIQEEDLEPLKQRPSPGRPSKSKEDEAVETPAATASAQGGQRTKTAAVSMQTSALTAAAGAAEAVAEPQAVKPKAKRAAKAATTLAAGKRLTRKGTKQ